MREQSPEELPFITFPGSQAGTCFRPPNKQRELFRFHMERERKGSEKENKKRNQRKEKSNRWVVFKDESKSPVEKTQKKKEAEKVGREGVSSSRERGCWNGTDKGVLSS